MSSNVIDKYIIKYPLEVKDLLDELRKIIKEEAPDAVEAFSYQMPTFKLNGKNLVHFAGWKDHVGFYPTPSGTDAFQKELSAYKGGKGSIQFPLDKPLPIELIRKIVKFRVEELKSAK